MKTLTKNNIHLHQDQILNHWLYAALLGNHPIAVWRRPDSHEVEIIVDSSGSIKRLIPELEQLPKGFIVHPFADQSDEKAYFLEASKYIKFSLRPDLSQNEEIELPEISIDPKTLNLAIKPLLNEAMENQGRSLQASTTMEDFEELVKKGMALIKEGVMSKFVPARTIIQGLPEDFDLAKTFLNLCQEYPKAFVNFFHIPKVGSWIGATPETLICTKGKYFQTMALAGTQPAIGPDPLANAGWRQKEIAEQALVSRYIVNNFKKIRLREYKEIGPKTVQAGSLLHLRSDFEVDMEATNFPQLGSVMLKLLHPTSAVCGSPRQEAMEFLAQYETFDRSFFAGYLGPVNIEDQTTIYVNLRTAQLQGDQVILYAGAGVTEDSVPEKEWEETSLKCNIIGKFFQ